MEEIIDIGTSKFNIDDEWYNEFCNKYEKDETTKKHTNRLKRVSVAGFIRNVLDSAPETLLNPYLQRYIGESYVKNQEVMGIPVNQLLAQDEKMKFQLQLLISMIQLDNRKGIEE